MPTFKKCCCAKTTDPLRLDDLLTGIESWVQIAGGYAMLGLCLWLLIGWPRSRPSDRLRIPLWQKLIFAAAFLGSEKFLRIDFDVEKGPISFVQQVLLALPPKVPAFGQTLGFVINYSLDRAVRFDSTPPLPTLASSARRGSQARALRSLPIRLLQATSVRGSLAILTRRRRMGIRTSEDA